MRAAHGGADQEMKGFQSALQTHLQGVDGATLSMGVVPVMADHAQPSFLRAAYHGAPDFAIDAYRRRPPRLPRMPRTMAAPTAVATERAADFIAASMTVSRW